MTLLNKDKLPAPKPAKITTLLILVIGILAVSTASLFIRKAQTNMSSLVIASGRMALSAIFLAPFVLKKKWLAIRSINKKDWLLLLLSGVFLGLHFATWVTSLEYTSIASSVVLVTTAPLWVTLLSPIILKEQPSRWILFGLIMALIGGVFVALAGICEIQEMSITCNKFNHALKKNMILGDGLALTGAFFSCGYLIIGRKIREQLTLPVYAFLVYTIAAMVLVAIGIFAGASFSGIQVEDYGWLVALAFIPQLIGHSSFNWALKYLSAALVSIALLGEPVGTVILAFIFLREQPVMLEVIGGLLILSGIGFATLKERSREKKIS